MPMPDIRHGGSWSSLDWLQYVPSSQSYEPVPTVWDAIDELRQEISSLRREVAEVRSVQTLKALGFVSGDEAVRLFNALGPEKEGSGVGSIR